MEVTQNKHKLVFIYQAALLFINFVDLFNVNKVIKFYLCLVCVQLQEKLALKEKELETKLLDSQLQEAELEACTSERAAGRMHG